MCGWRTCSWDSPSGNELGGSRRGRFGWRCGNGWGPRKQVPGLWCTYGCASCIKWTLCPSLQRWSCTTEQGHRRSQRIALNQMCNTEPTKINLTSTGSIARPKQITHNASSSAPSTSSLPFSRTARASRSRLASSALAATAAMHAGLCFFQWPRWHLFIYKMVLILLFVGGIFYYIILMMIWLILLIDWYDFFIIIDIIF